MTVTHYKSGERCKDVLLVLGAQLQHSFNWSQPRAVTESFIMCEWTHTRAQRCAHTLSRSANAFNHQHHRRQISVPSFFFATTIREVRGLVVNMLKDFSVIKDSEKHDPWWFLWEDSREGKAQAGSRRMSGDKHRGKGFEVGKQNGRVQAHVCYWQHWQLDVFKVQADLKLGWTVYI